MSNHPPTTPLSQDAIGRYKHYRGGEYEVICLARHSETEEQLVVYRQLDKSTGFWIRPAAMFFENIEHDGQMRPRFAKIGT